MVIKKEMPGRAPSENRENANIEQINVSQIGRDNDDSKSDEDMSNENYIDKYEAFKVTVQ